MALNVTKHNLVPKHIKLSDSEKKKFMEVHQITSRELPKIRVGDPALAKLNVKAGNIIKIQRSSKTMGTSNYYRVVVDE